MGALKNLRSLPELAKNASIAIETGSGYGTGIYELSRLPFSLILSVEIEKDQADLLAYFFRFDQRIRVYNSDSFQFLNAVLSKVHPTTQILFFLDSHFPGADLGKKGFTDETNEDIRLPLYEELKLIKDLRPNSKDIIICDDISLYDLPERQGLYEGSVVKNRPELAPKYKQDWIDVFQGMFSKTHASQINYQEQGYLIFTPNE